MTSRLETVCRTLAVSRRINPDQKWIMGLPLWQSLVSEVAPLLAASSLWKIKNAPENHREPLATLTGVADNLAKVSLLQDFSDRLDEAASCTVLSNLLYRVTLQETAQGLTVYMGPHTGISLPSLERMYPLQGLYSYELTQWIEADLADTLYKDRVVSNLDGINRYWLWDIAREITRRFGGNFNPGETISIYRMGSEAKFKLSLLVVGFELVATLAEMDSIDTIAGLRISRFFHPGAVCNRLALWLEHHVSRIPAQLDLEPRIDKLDPTFSAGTLTLDPAVLDKTLRATATTIHVKVNRPTTITLTVNDGKIQAEFIHDAQ